MYKILCILLIFGVGFSWAGLPEEEQHDDPNWVPKSDIDGNIVWHNPSQEDELEIEIEKVEMKPFAPTTSQFNCTNDYDCGLVATIPGSAKCYSGICKCRIENGFTGLALEWDKCTCHYPKVITWMDGAPMCTFNFQQHFLGTVNVMSSSSSSSAGFSGARVFSPK